ncbi:hypothetical protein FGO68_gene4539 [Halteria grandinella]|uniref:Uncharacterized protein n=1 Tax=Halteria grandinella TaxID=5974 RepID=A0A8J8SU72_HALGN|nr:hypothetical protein FGO68_gene4539 [Halteria grandinella]
MQQKQKNQNTNTYSLSKISTLRIRIQNGQNSRWMVKTLIIELILAFRYTMISKNIKKNQSISIWRLLSVTWHHG